VSEAVRYQTLLTGFGPFGTVLSNPSERLLKHFAEEEIPGRELTCCLLPVSYQRAPLLIQAAFERGSRNGRPFDEVLMLGVAGGSANWRVERFGRNYSETALDIDGYAPASPVIHLDAPNCLPSTLPVQDIVAEMERRGLPVIASESAGAYLCNHILFTTLYYLQRAGSPVRAGFLHVPADELTFPPEQSNKPQYPFDLHIEAVRAALTAIST
jgi:pyroglutamyl-peptidase